MVCGSLLAPRARLIGEQTRVQYFHVGPLQDAWTVLVDHQQRVWAGTRDEGLFQFETNQFEFVPDAEILGPQISVLFEDQAGQLWAGTPGGLGCWNGQDWKTYTTRDGLSGNAVSAMAEDAAGNLWMGTARRWFKLFQRRQVCFLPGIGKWPARQRHFLPLRGQRRRFVGGHLGPWPGPISSGTNGRVIRSATASSATASVTSSKMMQVIYGLVPIWG